MGLHSLGPRSAVVYDNLRERIAIGALPAGAQLPSQKELAHQYRVAPTTVRQALIRLADEGFVAAKMGRGTWVTSRGVVGEGVFHSSGEDASSRRDSGTSVVEPPRSTSGLLGGQRERPVRDVAATDRLVRLQGAAVTLSEALSPEAVATVAVEECVAASGAAAGSLFTMGSADLELLHSVGYDARTLAGFTRIPLNAPIPLAEAVRTGRPVWLPVNDLAERYPDIEAVTRRNGRETLVAVPLSTRSHVIGVLGLSFGEGSYLGQADQALILALASQSAQALDRACLFAAEREARLAAEAAEARMRETFRAAPLPIMLVNPERKLELWNPACERVFGWAEQEVLGARSPLLPTYGPGVSRDLLQPCLDGAAIEDVELRRRHKNGATLDLRASLAPFKDSSGLVTGVVAVGVDISEQKRAEEQLRASKERFRSIFERAPIGVNVTDASGRYLQTNPVFQRMLGYSEEELTSLTFSEITHPDDLGAGLDLFADLVDGKRDSYEVEKRFVRKDGAPVWVRLYISLLHADDGWAIVDGDDNTRAAVAIVEDITKRKYAEEALAASERRYRSVVETSRDGIAVTDLTGVVTFANQQMADLVALPSPEALIGRPHREFIAADDLRMIEAGRGRLLRQGHVANIRFNLSRADCVSLPCEMSASLVRDTAGAPAGVTTVIRDVTERQVYEDELRRQALHDALTGLPNRTLFNDRLGQAILSARREDKPFALLLVDLDRFKEVNDTLGHGTGDVLLQQAAVRFRDVLRESDTVARLGGDEFAIILPGADEEGAIQVINALQSHFAEPFLLGQHPFYLEFSIGVAVFPDHAQDAATLLQRADVAMYSAKRGGGPYALYEAKTDPNSEHRLALMTGLRRAIDEDQLVLHYQPKVNMETGEAAQVEALIRWAHPQFGLIPPDQFISLAEHAGLMRAMSRWVLNEALRQISSWRAEGRSITVAVNLSTYNLQERDLVDSIAALLVKWHLPASCLGIEITESALMIDPDHAMATLTILHDMGITVSIDDFGTGYSSLAYLQRLPADEVKIDRAFVGSMSAPNSGSSSIVRSVVDLGHTLGLRVVAEGVEHRRDLDILGSMGCDVAQGYYLGKPLPAHEYADWLDVWQRRGWLLSSGAAAS